MDSYCGLGVFAFDQWIFYVEETLVQTGDCGSKDDFFFEENGEEVGLH